MSKILLLSESSVMVGDRYRKRAKGRKRDIEREKHEQMKIEHDETEQWFTVDLPNSEGQAFLQYSIEDDGKIDLWHTEVRDILTLEFHALILPRCLRRHEVQELEVT